MQEVLGFGFERDEMRQRDFRKEVYRALWSLQDLSSRERESMFLVRTFHHQIANLYVRIIRIKSYRSNWRMPTLYRWAVNVERLSPEVGVPGPTAVAGAAHNGTPCSSTLS